MDRSSSSRIVAAALLAALVAVAPAGAAEMLRAPMPGAAPERLVPFGRFDPAIPTQEAVLGYRPGARPMRHAELMRYLEALADASPLAEIRPYAVSHEGRRLVMFRVSDAATIERLDEFKAEHAARTDPRGRAAGDDARALDGAKAVAWMAYGIHGDELSSVDAAAALAYWLVAGTDERAERIRRELVVLIDPCENPDGRDRFLAQTASFAHRTPNHDMEDLSHTTIWPWGRGNHFLFDLNRDWFSMVHPESARSALIASWHPQLMVDSHEMGSDDSYLLSPPRHPFNPHLPQHEKEWAGRFARDQARALDGRGYAYYTREWNEEFFPGYGSSWASYLGAIGILYEMSGTEGTLVKQSAGVVRTYAQAVEHQLTSSIANLETVASGRAELLEAFVASRRETIARARTGLVGTWVLPRARNVDRVDALAALLRSQGIELRRQDGDVPGGLIDSRTGASVEPATVPASAWVVPLDQPAGGLVRVLLDPHVPMSASFFREEREYLERGWGTRLYETTAWSLPLAYDVDAWWSAERAGSRSGDAPPAPPAAPVTAGRTGTARDAVRGAAASGALVGEFVDATDAVAFVMRGGSDASVAALARLLQEDVAVRIAGRPFRVGDRDHERGDVLIRVEGNEPRLRARLRGVVAAYPVEIAAVTTALAQQGPDLGGRHFRALRAPRVGVWTGALISPSSYGAIWHLLDEKLDLRFNAIDLLAAGRIDLDRYNVLVFPPALRGPSGYRNALGEAGVERLKRWVRGGGTAIGIGGGAAFLADGGTELTDARPRAQALERHPPVVLGPPAELVATSGDLRAVGLRAADEKKDDDEPSKENKKKKPTRSASPAPSGTRDAAFDVAPLLGPGAAPFARGHEQGRAVSMEPQSLAAWLGPLLPPGVDKPTKEDVERADARLRRFATRGTFLSVELDRESWLTWGIDADRLPVLVRASDTLVSGGGADVVAAFPDVERLHLGGLLWPETAGRLAHTAYMTRERVGRGQVILTLNEPEFRGWTLGTRRLLENAILYGPGLGTRWSAPW